MDLADFGHRWCEFPCQRNRHLLRSMCKQVEILLMIMCQRKGVMDPWVERHGNILNFDASGPMLRML